MWRNSNLSPTIDTCVTLNENEKTSLEFAPAGTVHCRRSSGSLNTTMLSGERMRTSAPPAASLRMLLAFAWTATGAERMPSQNAGPAAASAAASAACAAKYALCHGGAVRLSSRASQSTV